MKHRHRHTHRLTPSAVWIDPVTNRFPHRHLWTSGPDDSHEHSHADGVKHFHGGDALGLVEYWQRKLRWWCHKVWDEARSEALMQLL